MTTEKVAIFRNLLYKYLTWTNTRNFWTLFSANDYVLMHFNEGAINIFYDWKFFSIIRNQFHLNVVKANLFSHYCSCINVMLFMSVTNAYRNFNSHWIWILYENELWRIFKLKRALILKIIDNHVSNKEFAFTFVIKFLRIINKNISD